MCGRYYITPAALREAAELAEGPETEKDTAQQDKDTAQRDVGPGESAPVLLARGLRTESVRMTWGFPRQEGKGLLINARAETAWEKPTFRDSIHSRRCVILAGGFYEWNREKEKYTFRRADGTAVFLAGCYNRYRDGDRFVILTVPANASVAAVHERMPLILEAEELEDWLLDTGAAKKITGKTPAALKGETEYAQMSLFE